MTTDELKQQQIEQAKLEDTQAILDCLTEARYPLTLTNAVAVLRRGLATKPGAWTVTEEELAGYWKRVAETVAA